MKFTIARQRFLAELMRVNGAAGHKSSIPILANVLLDVNPSGEVKLRATDLDVSMQVTFSASAETASGQWAICVNARKLTDIVKSLPEGEITVTCQKDSDKLLIQSGRSKFTMAGLAADKFPEMDHPAKLKGVSIAASLLVFLIRQTEYCQTKMESRYTLDGVKLEIKDGIVRMIGTDGHRMSIVEGTLESGEASPTEIEILIPRNTLPELVAMAEGESVIKIACQRERLIAVTDRCILHSRLVSGVFPDYTRVIPAKHAHECQFDLAALRRAVQQVKLMTDARSHSMRMVLADQTMKLEAPATDLGDALSLISCEYAGPEIVTTVNCSYLEDWLNVCPTEKGKLELNDGQQQLVFRPVGDLKTTSRYILMPMRV